MTDPTKYSGSDRYCYQGTDVLINKMDIEDATLLSQADGELSAHRLLELGGAPISGLFDIEHLKKIHAYIFQDLYSFAGEIRNVDISKGSTLFASWQYIEVNADNLFSELKAEAFLSGMSKQLFAKRASYYMAELNMLHPFREGNGRVIREFIRCIAAYCGFTLNWNAISESEILNASIESVLDTKAGSSLNRVGT